MAEPSFALMGFGGQVGIRAPIIEIYVCCGGGIACLPAGRAYLPAMPGYRNRQTRHDDIQFTYAAMAELAYAHGLGPCEVTLLEVQILFAAI